MPTHRCVVITALTLAAAAHAASFNCAKANTPSEKLICSTPELSDLDDKSAAAYHAALATSESKVRTDQQAWLKYVLATCRDAAAMREAYAARIATLEFAVHPTAAPANPQFTALHYSRDEYSKFTQIRSVPPHPVIETFNAWQRSTLADHPSATYYFDEVEIVANRYVSAYLGIEDYEPGAAHGAPVRASLTLDLETGKEIALDALFRRGSKFPERLAALVDDELRTSWKHGEWQYDDEWVARGLAGPPTDLFHLIPGGLALHYRPYILGPYSSGDANIYIPYSKLADLADPAGPLAIAGKLPFTHKHAWDRTPIAARPPWKGVTKRNLRDGQLYVFIPPSSTTTGFWLTQDPVTQAAYQHVTGQNPSRFAGSPDLPVESINWQQAVDYCRAIGGRLPTEAEWEYAARAGDPGPLYGKPDEIAWHSLNSSQRTHEVGQKLPNAFGLYDTIGNVRVWTASDPGGGVKSLRGHSYFSHPTQLEVWRRDSLDPSVSSDTIGIRCIANLL
ncbi:MAG TPA: SUMF1/EgtB/PvdO family nonheme iron enzyme [Bryobacteraceae bacterium]